MKLVFVRKARDLQESKCGRFALVRTRNDKLNCDQFTALRRDLEGKLSPAMPGRPLILLARVRLEEAMAACEKRATQERAIAEADCKARAAGVKPATSDDYTSNERDEHA